MQIGTDTLEADPTVGEALLGLDWKRRALKLACGDWQVQVFVNEELHSTLDFTVEGGAARKHRPGGSVAVARRSTFVRFFAEDKYPPLSIVVVAGVYSG